MSKEYSDVWLLFLEVGREGAFAEAKIGDVKKNCILRSVQFLVSFITFYFEILSYLACGGKITKLAYKNSVKLGEKSASDF